MIVGWALLACAPAPLDVQVTRETDGWSVTSSHSLDRIEVLDGTGRLLADQPMSGTIGMVRHGRQPGDYVFRASGAGQVREVVANRPDPGLFSVWVEAPVGQNRVDETVWMVDGQTGRAALVVEAHEPVTISVPYEPPTRSLQAGERGVWILPLTDQGLHGEVRGGGHHVPFDVEPIRVSASELAAQLTIDAVDVPARFDGRRDDTLPAGRLPLPSLWWSEMLDQLGLGFRPRDDQAPRTMVGVQLSNHSDNALHGVVGLAVLKDDKPHPAFRPRLRDADALAGVQRLIRVPAHQSVRVALPMYVDTGAIYGSETVTIHTDVRLLGLDGALADDEVTLAVERGLGWALPVWLLGMATGALGGLWTLWKSRTWMARPTLELATIACFSALDFVVFSAGQILAFGLGGWLGPFAPFVLGLGEDVVRFALWATLLSRVHRPGTLGLLIVVVGLLRAAMWGEVHPLGWVLLFSTLFLSEMGAGISGVYRGRLGFLPLAITLAVPNLVGTAVALSSSVVMFRLWFSDTYVLAMILLPGTLYPLFGCALAGPFARRLREVAP